MNATHGGQNNMISIKLPPSIDSPLSLLAKATKNPTKTPTIR
jgi:hypothetical protein